MISEKTAIVLANHGSIWKTEAGEDRLYCLCDTSVMLAGPDLDAVYKQHIRDVLLAADALPPIRTDGTGVEWSAGYEVGEL